MHDIETGRIDIKKDRAMIMPLLMGQAAGACDTLLTGEWDSIAASFFFFFVFFARNDPALKLVPAGRLTLPARSKCTLAL